MSELRLLGLDFETTGLSPVEDRAIELGLVIWDAIKARPLYCHSSLLYDETYPELSPEISDITGITKDDLDEFGVNPKFELSALLQICADHKISFIVAHNGTNFDKPLLRAELSRNLPHEQFPDIPWIDTKTDIPNLNNADSKKLKYLAADHGFVNPFSHRALFDVLTMFEILSRYDIHEVIKYSNVPNIIIRAMVPAPWDDGGVGKDLAKKNGYRWEKIGNKSFDKCWVKEIKENELSSEIEKMSEYNVVKIGG